MYLFRCFICLITLALTSYLSAAQVPVEAGVSLDLSKSRAARVRHLKYSLFFDLPASIAAPIPAQVVLDFDLSAEKEPLLLDFKAPASHFKSIQVNGRTISKTFKSGHIIIPARHLRAGANSVRIECTAGDMSLNRNEDYLYTLLVPDRASTAFPCFDQPDLKARYQLRLELPADWEASANGSIDTIQSKGTRKEILFKETQPFSTYLFAFAAGRLGKRTQTRNGRAMTMYFRETDQEKVDRNTTAIFDLHSEAIQWLEAYTGTPFPFDKLDFVLLPGFQYGGMEHVDNIFYREPAMLLDESATDNQKLARARLIAHETAHLWFGDLVTMRWFNDVWLKEVFANFMAAKAVNPAFPEINHDLSFMLGHQPTAYSEDRSGGSHPIQQNLENLKDAGSLYGGIIYQKAPIVMRQLEGLMGADAFRQGLQQYLRTFAFSNATWDDLIGILDALSPQDLSAWSQVWVKEAGMPIMRTTWTTTGSTLSTLRIIQEKPSASGVYWIQHTSLALIYPDTVISLPVRIEGRETTAAIPPGLPVPQAVLSNGTAMSYGYFQLDPISLPYLLQHTPQLNDPLLRGASWIALYEELIRGNIAPHLFLSSVLEALATEQEPLNRQHLLGYLGTLFWRFSPPSVRQEIAPEIEGLLWKLLEQAPTPSAKAAYYGTYSHIALTPKAFDQLYALWEGQQSIPGLPLSESQKISLAIELALRNPALAEAILDRQIAQTQNPDRQKRLAFIRPALSPQEAVRDAFFDSLKEGANRSVEPWVVDAAEYLNHPLRAGSSEKYILPSLQLLEEIQRTGDIFFPRQFISAVLGGHQSKEAAQIVRSFLQHHPEFPYRLRNKTLMAADVLFRVSEANW